MIDSASTYEQKAESVLTDSAGEKDQAEAALAIARAQVYATLAVASVIEDLLIESQR